MGVWRRKKYRTGQEKVTKGFYFTYLGKSPHWSNLATCYIKNCVVSDVLDVVENVTYYTIFDVDCFSGGFSPRNDVCQVSKWNFQGLRFYRGSNFPFSYWFLNGPYNSALALPVIAKWNRHSSLQNVLACFATRVLGQLLKVSILPFKSIGNSLQPSQPRSLQKGSFNWQ